MTKLIFGLFAHPDDETFTSGGTLLMESQAGTVIHLITLTSGDAGTNPDNLDDLGTERLNEWRTAGTILGAASMEHFGYKDGHLDNMAMIEIIDRFETHVKQILAATPVDAEVEFMTLDLNGYTGHIDHIVAARAATAVFYHLKSADSRLTCIRYSCLPESIAPSVNTDWIYMDKGHVAGEIDQTVDARHLHDTIVKTVHAHRSQRGDGETLLKNRGNDLGLNYFIVRS